MKETGKGERALENNQSQLSLVHLASYFPSKKELNFENLGVSGNPGGSFGKLPEIQEVK